MKQLKSKMLSTVATMGKWKKAFGSPKTDSSENKDNSVSGDGLNQTSTTKKTEKISFLTQAMKTHQQMPTQTLKSEEANTVPDNGIKHDSDGDTEVAITDKYDVTNLKSGSRLANANNNSNKWRDDSLNSNILKTNFQKIDIPARSTPPVSHLQRNRVHTPLTPSFDSKPPDSRKSSASSGVGRSVASASSIFDIDDSVF